MTVLILLLASIFLVRGSMYAFEPQVLFSFQTAIGTPAGMLAQGSDGSFYGTTARGGASGNGTVFRITPAGALTTLASDEHKRTFTLLVQFQGTNGANPQSPLVLGNDGNMYGTTANGGVGGGGTIYRIILVPNITNIARQPTGDVVLNGTGPSNSPYRLWASHDLQTPVASWTVLTNGVFAADGILLPRHWNDGGACGIVSGEQPVRTVGGFLASPRTS